VTRWAISRRRNGPFQNAKIIQRLFIANGDAASINLNQTVLLQSRQRARYDFWRRAYSRDDLLIGQNQRHFEACASPKLDSPVFSTTSLVVLPTTIFHIKIRT
jgi:hypothetical protein